MTMLMDELRINIVLDYFNLWLKLFISFCKNGVCLVAFMKQALQLFDLLLYNIITLLKFIRIGV